MNQYFDKFEYLSRLVAPCHQYYYFRLPTTGMLHTKHKKRLVPLWVNKPFLLHYNFCIYFCPIGSKPRPYTPIAAD